MPTRPMLGSVLVGEEKGRLLLMPLDQIELLNGVLDHRPLLLPRMDYDRAERTHNAERGVSGASRGMDGPQTSLVFIHLKEYSR